MTDEDQIRALLAQIPAPPSHADLERGLREGRHIVRRRRFTVAGVVAAALAALIAVPAVASGPGHRPGATGGGQAAGTRSIPMTLSDYRVAATKALDDSTVIQHSVMTSDTGKTELWVYQETPSTARVHIREFYTSGHLRYDRAVRAVHSGRDSEVIWYIGAVNEWSTWTERLGPKGGSRRPNAPLEGPDRLRQLLADPHLHLDGRQTLNGKQAIVISYHVALGSGQDYKSGTLWLDPDTYRTMKFVGGLNDNTITAVYDYPRATEANLAKLWVTPQPDWHKVSPEELQSHVDS